MALIEHRGIRPRVHATALVAASAQVIGDVSIGAETRILAGAVISAHDGSVRIGEHVVVMEHALVRGRAAHPVEIGSFVMIGPHTHVNGARVDDEVFVATGVSIFPGARIGIGCELRVGAVVQVGTVLAPGTVVPIGWVAVGDESGLFPASSHDDIWRVQEGLDFPGTVYGVPRGTSMRALMRQQSQLYAAHRDDRLVDENIGGST